MANHNKLIHTLEQALQIVNLSEYANGNTTNLSLWFRGQSSDTYDLEPSIFRDIKSGNTYNESEMLKHSKFRNPNQYFKINNEFQWLCLMQHYDLPTRVLDWSESVLIALYFAVSSKHNKDRDSSLFVLDTKKLNTQVTFGVYRGRVTTPEDLNVISRMAFIHANDKKSWEDAINQVMPVDYDRYKKDTGLEFSINDFTTPIAVYPYRTEERMLFQSSTFTLHGGKRNKENIPEPISLQQLNNLKCPNEQFLQKYIIPAANKEHIKRQLKLIGIHEGSLFPELDKQASYLKEYFTTGE
jgi:hypothetical protein